MNTMKLAPTHQHTNELIQQGYPIVAGVDEVGRGCLAGPLTVAAVVLPPDVELPGVTDSKLLSQQDRERLAISVKRSALGIGIGWVAPELIDEHGLTWALAQAAKLALSGMRLAYDAVLLDGHHDYLGDDFFVQTVVKGDLVCLNIAAASIVAKVARDNYMRLQHRLYPEYGFDRHVGYGTTAHLAAIKMGLSPLHRRSFAPVGKIEAAAFKEFTQRDNKEFFDVD